MSFCRVIVCDLYCLIFNNNYIYQYRVEVILKYILVADDEEQNQDILNEMLMDYYEVNCVPDGITCLEAIEKRIPDLLLLDISMPGMDGYEVCKKLRLNNETKDLPIVLLSGFATQECIKKGFDVGVNEYVTKPFTSKELYNCVNTLLEI